MNEVGQMVKKNLLESKSEGEREGESNTLFISLCFHFPLKFLPPQLPFSALRPVLRCLCNLRFMANCYGVSWGGGGEKQYGGHAANVITAVIAVSLYVVSFLRLFLL